MYSILKGLRPKKTPKPDPANIKELVDILTYHVIAGAAVFAKDLKPEQSVKTLEGLDVNITASSRDGVRINGNSKVTTADVAATNGVVHIIDTVLLPPKPPAPPAPKENCAGKQNFVCSSKMSFCLGNFELWCGAGTKCNPQGWKDLSPCVFA